MATWIAIAYVWLIGVRDALLSRALLQDTSLDGELNPIARWLAANCGIDALMLLKIVGLLVFTAAAIIVTRTHPRVGQRLIVFGVAASVLLAVWWDYVLFATIPCQAFARSN